MKRNTPLTDAVSAEPGDNELRAARMVRHARDMEHNFNIAHLFERRWEKASRQSEERLQEAGNEIERLTAKLLKCEKEIDRLAQLPSHSLRQSTKAMQETAAKFADERNEFTEDVDGSLYWWPDGHEHGHYASHHLRALADVLDERNKTKAP